MYIAKYLRLIKENIRNIFKKLRNFLIFNVNFNEFIRIFFVSSIFYDLYTAV